jgi:hypothetical protein
LDLLNLINCYIENGEKLNDFLGDRSQTFSFDQQYL